MIPSTLFLSLSLSLSLSVAARAPVVKQPSPVAPVQTPKMITSIKTLSESHNLTSIPSTYSFNGTDHKLPVASDSDVSIPVIDFSLLTSGTHDQRAQVIQDLEKACQEWGFFLVINHGVSESLMTAVIDGVRDFFNLTEEEKSEYAGQQVLDPIRCGTSFNTSVEKVFFWRDFLKVFVHPTFHMPNKPLGFSEIAFEYCKTIREVASGLLRGILESLQLEPSNIEKSLDVQNGFQVFIANLYPPCPQPELALGMPPHSDHGLLTLLIENGIGGLQLQHKGRWVNVKAVPNSFLVNTGDHIEILSNGKYKSVVHRVVVNNKATRISLAVANGPSLETVVSPAAELVDNESNPAAFVGMKYKEYLQLQQSSQLNQKSVLDRVRI